jgi:DtxR family Mn-dependent transcriptional regulator
MPDEELTPILSLQPGQQAILRRVGTDDASMLRYLGRLSLVPGQRLRLIDRAPFNGPITLEVLSETDELPHHRNGDTGTVQILGNELADRLYVSLAS